jgi:uncharacterized protein YfaS (alpha-2-macroglobulin family)
MTLAGCGTKGSGEQLAVAYNPYVEAFTAGRISRHAPMSIVMSKELPAEALNDESLRNIVKIKPSVEGEFSSDDGRTITFRPKNGFKRDAQYTVKMDVGKLFGEVRDDERTFTFGFTTLPFAVRAHLASLDVNGENAENYDIVATLVTADSETPEDIEKLVELSEKATVVWSHSADGRKHEATLQGVEPHNASRYLSLSAASNNFGLERGSLLDVVVPAKDDFSVYSVEYQGTPERRIVATFSRPLNASQILTGLANIVGNRSEVVRREGNKIFLYPDEGRTGSLTVTIDKSINSKDGKTLSEGGSYVVNVGETTPSVNFIGNGVIIPQSDKLNIPFQAVYLRGVTVKVIKIMEQNIGQFLQINQLDGSSELMRVGRLVARKTIFLDEDPTVDLTQLNTYAIDLNTLMQPEPGAIYRIYLMMDRQLSAYQCGEGSNSDDEPAFRQMSRREIEARDERLFREESERLDRGGYYYYSDDDEDYYYDYDYNQRDNPCHETYYRATSSPVRNVMASNLGVIAMAGEADGYTVLVHNLLSTKPEKDVTVRLFNYQNKLMGESVTNDEGYAQIAVNGGRPFYIVASQGPQRGYLRVDNASSLSLSSFDVSGEVIYKGMKGFIYGERGVWRPGDELHLGFMLSDRLGTLPADHPVTMELYNPLGQMVHTRTATRGELGVYAFSFPTDPEAPTGAWNVKVHVGGVTFEKRIRVETIKPNRLKINIKIDDPLLVRGRQSQARMHVEWLQGATARNLRYEIATSFASIPTSFAEYKGYVFDDPIKSFSDEGSLVINGSTDAEGNALIRLGDNQASVPTVPEEPADEDEAVVDGPDVTATTITGAVNITAFNPDADAAPGMLLATMNTRVFEQSGDFSMDAFSMKFSPYRRYVGILSPQKDREQLNTGSSHTYKLASVDYDGKPQRDVDLRVEVYKMDWYWWWSSDRSSLASYISDRGAKHVKTFTLTTSRSGEAKFDLEFGNNEWGTYFIQVSDVSGGHSTGVVSYFDWPYGHSRSDEGSNGATLLSFKPDKESYKPGEKISVTIPSSKGSRAVVAVQNGSKVLSVKDFECKDKETVIKIEATPEMTPNAYLYITLLQPHAQTLNDMPIRMYGVTPVVVTSEESHLAPVIGTPDEIKPESKYEITVSEKNGQEMAYTLAIVDEGLLDLTRFKTPDPWRAFNAREALGVNTWDLYNYIVGAYGGRIEQLFSIGGDDAIAGSPKAIVNRFPPVVKFEGPFLLKKGGKARHKYDMPNYNGRVRVMVVAGNGRAYGNAEKSVTVRKPVMVIGTLPRVIGLGEEMSAPATVFATENNVGPVEVAISCSDNMQIVGPAKQTLNFKERDDKQAVFRIRVTGRQGKGHVTITASAKGDKSTYETDIEIRSVRLPQSRVTAFTLKPGESWNQNVAMPGADGTNKLTLEVSNVEPLNLASRLGYLIGYPHGCIEQITSKGFPQLYLKELTTLTKEQSATVEEAVKEVIRRQRTYQTGEGGMSYWPGGSDAHSWGSTYAAHFQCEAEAKGFSVPSQMKTSLTGYLRRVARNWKPSSGGSYARSEEATQAYRLYVLALGGSAELGAMNRLKESKNLSQTSRWMLAMAYAKAGRKEVATELATRTVGVEAETYNEYDMTFGSSLRDQAVILQTLCMLDRGAEAAEQARAISKAFATEEWYSTQTTAYGLMAMAGYMAKYKVSGNLEFSYSCGSAKDRVSVGNSLWSRQLLDKGAKQVAVELKNTSGSTEFVRIIAEGIPEQGEERAYANGLTVTVSYLDRSGRPVAVDALGQGVNFTAVATVRNPSPKSYNNVAVTQIFPSGWEILNTRFTDGESTDRYPDGVNYQDIRDDRVYSYIDRLPSGRQVTLRVNLCTVYPGLFYLPPISAEAMYDHTVRANTEGRNIKVE